MLHLELRPLAQYAIKVTVCVLVPVHSIPTTITVHHVIGNAHTVNHPVLIALNATQKHILQVPHLFVVAV